MAIGGIGRQVARSAEDIAALLRTARRRLTTPEWSGPGIEFTRPLPRNRSGVPLEPLPETAAVRAPVYEGRGIPEVPDGPRTVQFPQLDVNEAGEDITRYVAEDIVPIRPEFLDFFDESVSIDPVRAQFELANFIENLTTPNELYRASVLMQRIRPRMNRQMTKGLERALEEAALRVGVPPTQRMGPMYLFQYVSPEGVPPVRERAVDTVVDLRKKLRKDAGGSAPKARKGGFVRLSNLEQWDSGPNGGVIGTARIEGLIDEVEELHLRGQLDYWRGQIYEGMGIDPASMRGIQALKLSDDMPEQERFMRLAQAMRTADSQDELVSIFSEVDQFIVSSSYRDMLEDVVDAQVRRLALAGEEAGESLTSLRRSIYGQSDDLERGGLETFTPEEEFVTRSLFEGARLYSAPAEDTRVVLDRVNERLRRLGVEPINPTASGLPRPRRLGSAARDPQPMPSGGPSPMKYETWQWIREKRMEETGELLPRVPEWGYVSRPEPGDKGGAWILPKQSGMGSAVAPQRGRSVQLSQREIDEQVLNMLIEEGAVVNAGGAVYRVPDAAIQAGTDRQRAWAERYGQARVDQLMSNDALTKAEAVEATVKAKAEGLISDEMLKELRVAAGVTPRATPSQPQVLGRYDLSLGRFLDEGKQGSGFANIRLRPVRKAQMPTPQRAATAQPTSLNVSRETPSAPTVAQASRLGTLNPADETQIFVFGSNLQGVHGAGAARTARDSWGARQGVGRGLTGRSYALPTKRTPTREGRQLSLQELESEFAELRRVVEANPDKTFMLSPVGTGLGGYSVNEIAAIVAKFDWPQNFKIVDVNQQGAVNFIRAIQRAKTQAPS